MYWLVRIKRQPLQGQLLPYLTAEEATQQGLKFREEHGWIEEEWAAGANQWRPYG